MNFYHTVYLAVVSEVADYYQKRGTPIICVTLDCSKAFDKYRFDKLRNYWQGMLLQL